MRASHGQFRGIAHAHGLFGQAVAGQPVARRQPVSREQGRWRCSMALRSRLSLAFVFVVLLPVLVGSLVVLIAVPRILREQIGDRLRTASVSVTDVLAARCTEANQAAQLLGLEVAALGPAAAVKQMVTAGTVDYAVVAGANSAVVASAGRLPNGTTPTPLPAVLNSCGDHTNAGLAISSRATLDLAAAPSLKSVAVAWAVGATTATNLRAVLVSHPAVTLLVDGATVLSTLSKAQAGKQATAAHNANTSSVSITCLLYTSDAADDLLCVDL